MSRTLPPQAGRTPRTAKPSADRDLAAAFVHAFDRMHDQVMMPSPHPALPLHISPPEGKALVWLGSQPSATMSGFATAMRIPLSTATHLVDRLVEKGIFLRERSETDRRAVSIRLTEVGKRMHRGFYHQRLAGGKRLLAHLNPAEQAQLIGLLEKSLLPLYPGLSLMTPE